MVADRLTPTLGHLVCHVLVGRDAELGTLWAAVQRAVAGVGGSVVVAGRRASGNAAGSRSRRRLRGRWV